jgi:signal transduction histidine kinase
VIVALTVPLAFNLRARAQAELETQALVTAQTIAAGIGAEGLTPTPQARRDLQRQAEGFSRQIDGRVLVMGPTGRVLADANPFPLPPTSAVGEDYLTLSRPEIVAALDQGRADSRVRTSDELGTDIMVAAAPIIDEDAGGVPTVVGAVRITLNVEEVSASVRRVTLGLIVIGLGGLLAGMLVAFGLAGSLADPLQRLASAARRLGTGDLSVRAGDVGGAAEIRDLAASFDEMADRLERTVQAQREFVANASHQLRTPLTGMKLRLEAARTDAETGRREDLARQVEAADREVDRLSATVDRMLLMAHDIERGEAIHVDLADAARIAVERWGDRAEAIELSTPAGDGPGATLAQINPTDLDQILDNLLDNAIAYAPGPIEVRVRPEGRRVTLVVRDHGPGIPQDEQVRVTERFYRGRGAPAGGSGLGLAVARDAAEKWGGALSVTDAEGGGTAIEVRLRSAASPETPGTTTEQERP